MALMVPPVHRDPLAQKVHRVPRAYKATRASLARTVQMALQDPLDHKAHRASLVQMVLMAHRVLRVSRVL
jgi:hypothetical protein